MKYLAMLPFWECEVGTYQSGAFHCTLMYWFQPGPLLKEGEIFAGLDTLSRKYLTGGGIELVGSHEEHGFGPYSNVSVTVLHENQTLLQMHSELKLFLDERRCAHQELRWIGNCFRPHVTHVGQSIFQSGNRWTVRQIALLRADDGGRKDICYVSAGN